MSSPAKDPVVLDTNGIPLVSSSMRSAEPVAVRSVTSRSCATSAARARDLRSFFTDLYICAVARLTDWMSGWPAGSSCS